MIEVSESSTSAAGADVVYDLLARGETWPNWTTITSFELRSPAADGTEGVGAIRVWKTGPLKTVERVSITEPGRRFGYELVQCRSLPVRDYSVVISLARTAAGTEVTWTGTFRPLIPGTGPIYQRVIRTIYRRFVTGLTAHADEAAER